MHAVVSDQQKRLDALTLENERLRQELHDRHQAWFTKETGVVATDRTRKLVVGREAHQIQSIQIQHGKHIRNWLVINDKGWCFFC